MLIFLATGGGRKVPETSFSPFGPPKAIPRRGFAAPSSISARSDSPIAGLRNICTTLARPLRSAYLFLRGHKPRWREEVDDDENSHCAACPHSLANFNFQEPRDQCSSTGDANGQDGPKDH